VNFITNLKSPLKVGGRGTILFALICPWVTSINFVLSNRRGYAMEPFNKLRRALVMDNIMSLSRGRLFCKSGVKRCSMGLAMNCERRGREGDFSLLQITALRYPCNT